ncbi:hypothetical protein AK812_SmicGene39484 [Symbiodinium microadriaticum]|uniref:Uncharacterized protein n=1 Tax=Symbiodinium microadriaticum TaxID=2951 RepID=A0A1Q9CB39_SYMMI|nr:hypothetical protein AK812_SmicGene39484 [Symbiodinium microadriaticum]
MLLDEKRLKSIALLIELLLELSSNVGSDGANRCLNSLLQRLRMLSNLIFDLGKIGLLCCHSLLNSTDLLTKGLIRTKELIKRAAVKWGLLLLTTVATMAALFWTLYMRLEGLFRDLSILHLLDMQSESNTEDLQELRQQMAHRSKMIERLRHYRPLIVWLFFICLEIALLWYLGYLDELADQVVEYGALGVTVVALVFTGFTTAYIRVEGIFTDLFHLGTKNLHDVEAIIKKVVRFESCRGFWRCR